MFTYRIWFKSGNDIEGEMDEDNSTKLKGAFKLRKHIPRPTPLEDTDGELILDLNEVEAISLIPKKPDPSTVGFNN